MQTTDTLHLKFYATQDVSTPGPDDRAFWLSLMYALLQGASRALQIERRDIDGVLFPRRDDVNWQQTIVLFDDVPGGAGHVKRIRDEIGSVIAAALEIVDCECDPATSCYRCLREYSNQWEHSLLERGRVEVFLRALFASTSRIDTDVKGAHAVVAAKPAVWLQEQLLAAKDEVWILAEDIVFEEEDTETWRWFDTLEKLLLRNVRVRLFVMADLTPRRNQPGTVFRAHLLQSMLARGLRLENTNKPLDWQILIDPTSDNPRAIRAQKGMIVLGPSLNRTDLQSTSHSQAVREIWHKTSDYRGSRVLSGQDLEQPGDTSVIDTADLRWPMFESDIFGHCFEKPVAALRVNDRYLYDRERIVDRLGAYVAMAAAQGRLQEVTVNTWPAGQGSLSRYSVEAQSQAISDLEKRHPTVSFRFIRAKQKTEHDRFVVIQYANGDKARILIGSGLDFIESDGRLRRTYIVIEDPYLA